MADRFKEIVTTDGANATWSITPYTGETAGTPVLQVKDNGEITGTGVTTTGEANKLFKFSSVANTILHFLRIRKSSTTALNVQDDSSVDVLNVDTTNKIVTSYNQKISSLAGTGNRMVVADSAGNLSAGGITVFNTTKEMGSNTADWTDLINGVLDYGIYDFYVNFWYAGNFHFKEKFTVCITKDPVEMLSYDIMSNGRIASITTGTGADFGKINLTLGTVAGQAIVRYIKWA